MKTAHPRDFVGDDVLALPFSQRMGYPLPS